MTNALKIYGREFDEVKKYSDGIKFSNVVTYDKKNNTPDAVVKNLARVLGWQLTSSISQIDVIGNFLSLNNCSNSGIPGSDLRLRVLPVVAFTFMLQNFGFTIIGSSGFML